MTKPVPDDLAPARADQSAAGRRRQTRTMTLRSHAQAQTAGDRDPDPSAAESQAPTALLTPPESQEPPTSPTSPALPTLPPLALPRTPGEWVDVKGVPSAPSPRPPETRAWALLLFMKPDARLEAEVSADLSELKRVPALTTAYAGAQVERLTDVERVEIEGDGKARLHPSPPRGVGGLPDAVSDFAAWTLQAFPAERRLAVMWGHASGVGFDLAIPRDRPGENPFLPWKPALRPMPGPDGATPVPETPSTPAPREVDPQQFTIQTLVKCVERMRAPAPDRPEWKPPPRLDLLGLDSCYMSSVECGYELREHVDYLVASESFMLNQGWNYRAVLGAVASGTPAPEAVGRAIVKHVTTLPGDGSLSMLALRGMEPFAAAFTTLVDALSARINDPVERQALQIVLERVAFLKVRQFLDVRDLCHKLIQYFDGPVAQAAAQILPLLNEDFLFHRATGRALGRLNGLSIFYPYVRARRMRLFDAADEEVNAVVEPAAYKDLAFVKATRWGDLLDRLFDL